MATLTSKIISSRGSNDIDNLYVEVWTKNANHDHLLGGTFANDDGNFSIAYDERELQPAPAGDGQKVYVKVYHDDHLIKNTSDQPVVIQRDTIPNITIAQNQNGTPPPSNIVQGVIATPKGRGIPNLIVRAYNKTTRAELFLSEGRTNNKGEYLIYYTQPENESRNNPNAVDLVVKAFTGISERQPIITSPLIVNALQQEFINLSVGEGVYQGLDTYTFIHEMLEDSLTQTALNDLSPREVIILANTFKLEVQNVSFYIQARQWATAWEGLPAEVYFAWFKSGIRKHWAELLNTPIPQLVAGIDQAVESNYVPETTKNFKQGLAEKIAQWRTENLITARGERVEKGSIGDLLGSSSLNVNQRKQLLDDWQNFDGGIEEFWQRQQSSLGEENYKDLELTLQLGAVTRNHLPLIQSMKTKLRINRIQELATLKEADWLRLMEDDQLDVPEDIAGENLKSRRQQFASQLRNITEELVPTAVLAHSFKLDGDVDSTTLDSFMDRNPDFEFRTKTVKAYLKEKPDALGDVSDSTAAQKELEAVQRVFHLTPTKEKYKGAKVLWLNKLHSAYAIKMGGLESLQTLFDGDVELAEKIYNNASMRHSQAAMVKMQVQSLATPMHVLSTGVTALLQDMDDAADLEALFGDQGYCKCKHCDSFFSPSAYLVDLFLYLNKVKVNASGASPDQDTALEKLFKRRPDLGNIQLDCENSHTPLPYIDLVNEVIEMAIAPLTYQTTQVNIFGKTFTLPVANVPQTEGDVATLKAYPQYIKQEAYNILRLGDSNQSIGFPWILPFNLWLLEARTYLDHLGVSRFDLMESILGGSINKDIKVAEYLKIMPEEHSIFSETVANASTTLKYWGTNVSQLQKVPIFLKQTGYSYEKLAKLLRLRYIQPAQTIVFNPPSSCSISDASIPNLTDEVLGRIHKLGRLLLKTSEDMHSLDRTIMAFGGDINNAFLEKYVDLLQVEKLVKTKIDRKELLSWYVLLEREDYQGDPSLYGKLFMTPEEIPAFQLNSTKDELLTTGVIIDPLATPLDPDLLSPILSATKLKAQDVQLLVTEEFPNQVISLNLSQLSYLYRTASFCRIMKLKVSDYLMLKKLLGIQPISSMDQMVSPGQSLSFINNYNTLKKSGLDAETLTYILRHQFRVNAPIAMTEGEIDKILKLLHAAIQLQLKEVFPAGTTIGEIVETKLKIIVGTNTAENVESVSVIQNIIAGSSGLSAPEQEQIIVDQMVFFLDKQDAKNQLLGGGLTDTHARFEYALSAINRYLLESNIVQQLSGAMGLPQRLMISILQKLLAHPSVPTARAIDVFLNDLFMQADPATVWTSAAWPDQFFTVMRLHKISLLIEALELELPDLVFLMDQGPVVSGMPDFNALPVQEISIVAGIETWITLFNLALLNKESFEEGSSVFDLLSLSQSNAVTKDALLIKLNEYTGWKIEDLHYLTGAEGLNLIFPQDYAKGDWLIEIAESLKLVSRIGASAKQMASWTSQNITKTQSDSIRHAAMAKYGETQWQEITVPLRHNIREAQRNALVQFVLHYRSKHNGVKFEDLDDIYGYFLVDTQMAACTDTSRIVLAASSVQLFVQRIMMNLEANMSLTKEFIKEWKWRKYYRVWEANRKVFMWPENWIEPELRDDKTPLFKELENELMQGELSTENIERAYVSYLEKLHEISHLKVVGMYYESDAFHVIAQTSGTPESYYYRRWENQSQWTAWEKIELDIFNGEEIEGTERGILLTPIVHNRRLFLFWPIFKIKKVDPTVDDVDLINQKKEEIDTKNADIRAEERNIANLSNEIDSLKKTRDDIVHIQKVFNADLWNGILETIESEIATREALIQTALSNITDKKESIRIKEDAIRELEKGYLRYQITMAWSQYRDGYWTPKKVGQNYIQTPVFVDDFQDGASLRNYAIRPLKSDDDGSLELYIIYTNNKKVYRLKSFFSFDNCKSEVDVVPSFTSVYQTHSDLKQSMWFMKSFRAGKPLNIINGSDKEILLLEDTFGFSFTSQSLQSGLYKTPSPFFYEDPQHSFFINPPSSSLISSKSALAAKTSSLKLGTSPLQDAVYKPKPDSNDGMKEVASAFKFTSSTTANKSFYEAGHANQVVVRKKDDHKLSSMTGADLSFGVSPAQNTNVLSYSKTKIVIDTNGYHFYLFYHPYTCLFLKQLNRYGIDGLLSPDDNTDDAKELLHQATPSHMSVQDFKEKYKPNLSEVIWYDVKEEIDFKHGGVYGTYNWELFYHIPLFVATRLSQDQRFDEAQKWFHYIFDPTETQGTVPYRFWKIKPFHTYTVSEMKKDIEAVMKGGTTIKKQIKAWEENPFNPHLLARFRRLAYMKTVIMKYLDNLIGWGDQLFRIDSIESMNEATQLYVLAGQILGKIPVETEAKPRPSKSFNELAAQLTEMGNAWVNLENSISNEFEEDVVMYSSNKNNAKYYKDTIISKIKSNKTKDIGRGGSTNILDDILYFCMSPNEKLLSYWDTVADRLFKLRNCMNIEGFVRSVPLFQPPIDPALLVKAVAAGVDISSAINDLYAPMPYYRFQILIQKAKELCQELKSLGSNLLSALEKKDAEQLSLIRSQHEIQLLEANKDIKKQQMEEARLSVVSLEESYKLAQIRHANYAERDFMNSSEIAANTLSAAAILFEIIAGVSATTAASVSQIPDIKISTHAQGMSSGSTVEVHPPGSGDKNEKSAMSFSSFFGLLASVTRQTSGIISTQAGYDRRQEDWDLQIDLAEQEMNQIDKQILGALIRQEISTREKENLDLQIENSKQVDAYMRNKYTNQELYSWLLGQIAAVYFQSYKMAYDIAKQAEKAFRFELGIESSNYIQFGYWDNLRKGLLSGEKLHHDLNRLEVAFLEKNKRDYEITKHISLAQLDPLALVRLRVMGQCDFEIPEVLYDMDYAGQFFRRLKSVSVSIPCIAGPYTSVSARLSLMKSRYRKNANTTPYVEEPLNDGRFIYSAGAIQSIATSNGQNDSGMFDLNFRDDRYLPFEGAGAISGWHLELPTEARQFDYNTISDVIFHVKYTAREGGSLLKSAANAALKDQLKVIRQSLNQEGLHIAISINHDLPNEWHLLKQNGVINLLVDKSRLPYMAQGLNTTIESVLIIAKAGNSPSINVDNSSVSLVLEPDLQVYRGVADDIQIDVAFNLSVATPGELEDLILVVKYGFD